MSKRRLTKKEKIFIARRARWRCEYCKYPANYSSQPFPNDHCEPESLGGPTEVWNLAYCCGYCNWDKGDKTHATDPLSGELVPLFNPRKEKWSEHFAWDSSLLKIIGLTPTGRATLQVIHLNRPEVVNLRRATRRTDDHPPVED